MSEGPGNSHLHHWGSLLALNGRGHALEVAPDKLRDSANTDWSGYDSNVLAVADGVVRDARDVGK